MDSSSDLSDPPSSDPPSSPLSELSKSPSLSPRNSLSRYPSPLSTAPSGSASPMKLSDPIEADSICVNPDGAPPPKRRKVERKPRTTERLSLHAASEQSEKDEELLEQLTAVLRKKKKIVIVAGAGISVSAGIPDFRSSHGLFQTLRTQHKLKASGKQLFDASVYKHDSSTSSFHDMVRELADQTKNAKPTPFHHMIASIAEEGRLLRLYSQNVDGIDTSMAPLATNVPLNPKSPWPKTVQLHGGLEKMVCSKCGDISDFDGSLFEGPEAPLCKGCEVTDNVRTSHAGKRSHGIGRLRPRMVLYNEYNPDEDAIFNVVKADIRARPDALIVVGTSMKIPGVRQIVKDMSKVVRARKDGITAWINLDPEPSGIELKDCWDLVVRGKCDDVATLVGLPHWDESPELPEADVKVDVKNFEMVKEKWRGKELEVRIATSPELPPAVKMEPRESASAEAKSKSLAKIQGIPTPTASPRMRTALPTKPQPKTKQVQLAFSGKATTKGSLPRPKPAAKVKDTTKTAQRKPRQKKVEVKPATTVKASFKATKASVAPATKLSLSSKRPLDIDSPDGGSISVKIVDASEFTLRPTESRKPRDGPVNKLDQDAVDSQLQQETSLHQAVPTTPTQPERPGSSHSLTISPSSVPRGMANLID